MTQAIELVRGFERKITVTPTAELEARLAAVPAVAALVNQIQVTDAATAEAATAMIRELKADIEQLDAGRKWAGEPVYEAWTAVNGLFKPALDALKGCVETLKQRTGQWQLAERRRHDEALLAAAAAQAQGQHAAAQTQLAVVNTAATVAPQGTSVKQVWVARVVDPAAVPRDWCTPDLDRIQRHARAAGEQPPAPIAGVVFEAQAAMTVRGRR